MPGTCPHIGPNSFIFTYIFGEKHPHRRSTLPPTGNPGSATANCSAVEGVTEECVFGVLLLTQVRFFVSWWLNPEALTVVDTDGMDIEEGDFIVISNREETVKEKQRGHGGWTPAMEKAKNFFAVAC